MDTFLEVKNVSFYTFACFPWRGEFHETLLYPLQIDFLQFLETENSRSRARTLRFASSRTRARWVRNPRMSIICIYICILLRNLKFYVFNIRERDFHVFEELQKYNNTCVYIYCFVEFLSPGGRAKVQESTHFCLPKCVRLLVHPSPFRNKCNNMHVYKRFIEFLSSPKKWISQISHTRA